jgi:hypothetical protein
MTSYQSPQMIFDKLYSYGLPFDVPNETLKDDYLKFLALKVFVQDVDGLIISPSIEIDEIWHQHLLYNKHYLELATYIDFLVYHYPERENDLELEKQKRRANFIKLYCMYFNNNSPVVYTNIFVLTLTNRTITIDVNLEKDTLQSLKYKVYEKEGITPPVQQYVYLGKSIKDDNKLLKDYGIEKDCILHLNLQLKGC